MRTTQLRSAAAAVLGIFFLSFASAPPLRSADAKTITVDQILGAYIAALGGKAAIDRVTTRQLTASQHRGSSMKVYWSAPNRVLREGHREREAYDGANGWFETKRRKIQRLSHSREQELQTEANPIRFIHLKEMFGELNVDTKPSPGAEGMDVISAPNKIGATRFFFDRETHLLARIEEFGTNSAYFTETTEFADYKDVDGIKLPRRILRRSQEPGLGKDDVRLSNIRQNVPLDPEIFRKPDIGKVVVGGKH